VDTILHATIPDKRPTMQVPLKHLIDDGPCSPTVRELRWPDGVKGPACQAPGTDGDRPRGSLYAALRGHDHRP
jgi:hypothetical protein